MLRTGIFGAALALTMIGNAAAADIAGDTSGAVEAPAADQWTSDTWRFQITPYAWLSGMSGDVRPLAGGPTFSVSNSIGDVLENVDGAFFLNGTARYNRFVLFGDMSWAESSKSNTISGLLPVPIGIEGNVTQTSFTAAAGYTVVAEPALAVDLLAGVRAWRIKAKVDVPLLGLSASSTKSWADPIVGARARVALSPKWSVVAYADVGGGGGGESTWQVLGTVNYQVTDTFFLSAGYRHMAFDYRDNGVILDVDMSGPVIGATLRF